MFKKIYLFPLFLVAFFSHYSLANLNDAAGNSVVSSKVTEHIDYLNEKNNKTIVAATTQPSLQSSDIPTLPPLTIPSAPPQINIPTPAVAIQSADDLVTKKEDKNEIALDKEQKKMEEEKNAELVNKLIDLNYNVATPPKKLYEQNLSTNNKHIPSVYFKSYYLYLAFKAVDDNNLDALRAVLGRYNFINGQNKDGDTLLIHAVETNSMNAARVLLAKGAYVNGVNYRGRTALHYAATLGDYEMVRLLLTMGADYAIVDDKGMSALDYANDTSNMEIISILSQYNKNK
jgi:ankyrin repeat protein